MKRLLSVIALLVTLFSGAQELDSTILKYNSLTELTFEELLNLEIRTASPFDQSVKEVPYDVQVITKEDIRVFGYRSLSEILQHVPGFYIHDDYTLYKENFGVRGMFRDSYNNNLIFLVNGVQQRNYRDYSNLLSVINVPVESIERIEIIKGPASVTYGAGAFFGAVNIVTVNKKDEIEVFGGVGTQGTWSGGDNVRRKIGKGYLNLCSGFSTTEGIDQNYNDISGDTNLSTQGFMNEEIRHLSITTEGELVKTTLSYDYNFNNRPGAAAPYASSLYEGDNEIVAVRTGLEIHKQLTPKLLVKGDYQFQLHQQELYFDFAGLNYDQEYQLSKNQSYTFDLNIKYDLTEQISLRYGSSLIQVSKMRDRIDAPVIGLANTNKELITPMMNWGHLVRLDYEPSTHLKLSLGGRVDRLYAYEIEQVYGEGYQYSDPDTLISVNNPFFVDTVFYPDEGYAFLPEASVIYEMKTGHILKLIYGESINRISMFRARSAYENGIDPEYIRSLELNYFGIVHSKLNVNTSLFLNHAYNLVSVEFELENGEQSQTASNTGEVRVVGLETKLDYRPNDKFRIDVSGNYYHTTDLEHPDVDYAYSPSFMGYLNAAYRFRDWSLALTMQYIGSTEARYSFELIDSTDPSSGEVGRVGDGAPAYTNIGLNLRWVPSFLPGSYINLRCSNLLDQKMYYPVNDYNAWTSKGTLGISRTLLLSMGYKF